MICKFMKYSILMPDKRHSVRINTVSNFESCYSYNTVSFLLLKKVLRLIKFLIKAMYKNGMSCCYMASRFNAILKFIPDK